MKHHTPYPIRSARRGFTLVELLVAVGVLLVLAGVTIGTLQYSASKEKVPNGARDMQSYLQGARDRAIFRRKPTGVRLILDNQGITDLSGNYATATSMVYIGVPDEKLSGTICIAYDLNPSSPDTHLRTLKFWFSGDGAPGNIGVDDDNDMPLMQFDNTGEFGWGTDATEVPLTALEAEFARLYQLGLVRAGSQITFRPGTLNPLNFTLQGDPTNGWRLSTDFPAGSFAACMDLEFEVQLLPAVLPGQQPRELAKGVAIDLRSSKLPPSWSSSGKFSNYMDILFSPRGVGFGQWTAAGQVHLVFADIEDIEKTVYDTSMTPNPPFPYNYTVRDNGGRERVLTINPASGNISMTSLYLGDSDGNNVFDDPFRYAETGVRTP